VFKVRREKNINNDPTLSSGIVTNVQEAINEASDKLSPFLINEGDIQVTVLDDIVDAIPDADQLIDDALDAIEDTLPIDELRNLQDQVSGAIDTVSQQATNFASNIAGSATGLVEDVVGGAAGLVGDVAGQAVDGAAGLVGDVAGQAVDAVRDGIDVGGIPSVDLPSVNLPQVNLGGRFVFNPATGEFEQFN